MAAEGQGGLDRRMGKGSSPRWYEDFAVGQRIECAGPRRVTSAERSAWIGLVGDPTPRYADEGDLVHPLVVLNIAQGQLARETHGRATEELGVAGLVVHRPVALEATLRSTARILGVREDPSRETGVVWIRVSTRDASGVVLSYVHWVRVPKKHKQSNTPKDSLPSLQDHVPPKELHTRSHVRLPTAHDTGARFRFDDYSARETILHAGATAVLPGDVGRFARWFRDVSPLRLPGAGQAASTGQVVGLAYALAHDGFEQRIGLGAINALRTPHRVVEGDTVYAMSQISRIEPLNEEVGAMRVRTFLFKGVDPSATAELPEITDGSRYHPYVALDMDLWELFPLR